MRQPFICLLVCASLVAAAPATDSKPPTVPSGLAVTSVTTNSVGLKWKASTDRGTGVAGYDVFINGSQAGSTAALTYNATGLAPSTTYKFQVRARDNAGNVSSLSSTVSATTSAPPCSAVPATPGGLTVPSVSSTSVSLLWNPVTPPPECTIIYNVYKHGAKITGDGITTTSYLAGGLTPSVTYSFEVSASDSFGESVISNPVPATTNTGGTGGGGFPSSLFAPYTDVTLSTPSFSGMAAATGNKYFSLAFIVAGSGCQASWGGLYGMSQNYMVSDIATLRGMGGDVIPSFGGAAGTELAGACTTVPTLQAQYQAVIDTYSATRLDFDVEGAALGNTTTIDRRNKAIAALQAAAAGAGKTLTVQFTLPVLPSGLTSAGIALLQNAITNGVDIGIVNVMAMDYGKSFDPNLMGQNAVNAMTATVAQLKTLYGAAKSDAQITAMIGVTPMIGLNDVSPEVFTLADASTLLSGAQSNQIGFLAFWSTGRDRQCPGSPTVSATCSGVIQSPWAYTNIFELFTIP